MEPQDRSPRQDQPEPAAAGFEKLAQEARKEARMLRDDKPITAADIERVRARANDYYARRNKVRKFTLEQFAAELGTLQTGRGESKVASANVLSQILNGTYKGTIEPYIRRMDELLSRERMRGDRFQAEPFVEIGLARLVQGVVKSAQRNESIGAVIMNPGEGKTTMANACRKLIEGAVMVTIETGEGDTHGVLRKLYAALNIPGVSGDRSRRRVLKEKLRDDCTVVILVDESQKLTAAGLETLRDVHDNAGGAHRIPMVLFGDHDFYVLMNFGRQGRGRIKPQLARRMYPILDSESPGSIPGRSRRRKDGRVEKFTEDELVKILRNDKLRIFTDDAIAYLTRVANLPNYGALGTVIAASRIAYDISQGATITVEMVKEALRMMLTEKIASLVMDEVEVGRPERMESIAATA